MGEDVILKIQLVRGKDLGRHSNGVDVFSKVNRAATFTVERGLPELLQVLLGGTTRDGALVVVARVGAALDLLLAVLAPFVLVSDRRVRNDLRSILIIRISNGDSNRGDSGGQRKSRGSRGGSVTAMSVMRVDGSAHLVGVGVSRCQNWIIGMNRSVVRDSFVDRGGM